MATASSLVGPVSAKATPLELIKMATIMVAIAETNPVARTIIAVPPDRVDTLQALILETATAP
jgi:hypothetical protein